MSAKNLVASGYRYKTGFYGGKFMPFHVGHLDTIIRCAAECEHLYVVVMHHGDEENEMMENYCHPFPKDCLDPDLRVNALRAQVKPLGNVEVLSYDCREADERASIEGKHLWHYECQDMVELMGHFDVAYSSELEYVGNFRRFYPWADAVVVDVERARFPISATMLRDMPFAKAYPYLPREYQKLINRKVLVAGPESGGKSHLVRELAMMLNTSYTEEMGRLCCEHYSASSPGASFYPGFVFAQKEAERVAIEKANMVAICDSDAIITAFYAEEYEDVHLDVAFEAARASGYDKVLFVEPSNPWVDDGLRTSPEPDERWAQSQKMKEMYAAVGYELEILDENYRSNYEKALASIQKMLGIEEAV